MTECIECGEEYPDKRAALGYEICLKCGSKKAYEQAVAKSKRIAPAYNKGNYTYITDGTNLSELGKK